MTPGKKPSTDIDDKPAKFPADLDIKAEMKAARHPGFSESEEKAHKKRKRLTFDEVSNIILEGIGNGPIRTGKALEAAARELKIKHGLLSIIVHISRKTPFFPPLPILSPP